MVLDVLTDSDEFFRRRATDPQLLPAALIVLVVGVANALGFLPSFRATLSVLSQFVGDVGTGVQAAGAVFVVVISFLQWLFYAGLSFAVAGLVLDGDGSFRATAALVGWGFAPLFVAAVVNAAVANYLYAGVAFPSDPAGIQQTLAGIQSSPLLLVGQVVGLACLLWSAYLWTLAVQHGHDLPRRSAAVSVAVPVFVPLLLRLVGLVGLF